MSTITGNVMDQDCDKIHHDQVDNSRLDRDGEHDGDNEHPGDTVDKDVDRP